MRLKETSLEKVDDTVTLTLCVNGFMLEVKGETEDGDYETVKLICQTSEEIKELIDELSLYKRR